jgi:glycine cleavage system H lipoate-binding protein
MAIGKALGYSSDQITTITSSVIGCTDKLTLLLDKTAVAHGHEFAKVEVLRACQEITPPIDGIISEELKPC